MPRARNAKADEALVLYRQGVKLKDIAVKLGVPEGTVRRWKSCFKWDDGRQPGKNTERLKRTLNTERSKRTFGKNTERSERKANAEKKKREGVREDVEAVLENPELNDRQRLFCLYFVRSFNATKAYQKAYGCSYENACWHGYEMLKKAEIKAEIERLKRARLNRDLLLAEDVFQKHLDIAFADITDFVEFGAEDAPMLTDDGEPVMTVDPETGEQVPAMRKRNYVTFRDSAEVDGTLIQEVRSGKNGACMKLLDKHKSLEWLAGMFDEERKARIEKLKADTAQAESGGGLADVIVAAYEEAVGEAPC